MRDKVKTLGQELEALGLHRYVDAQVLVPYASFYTNHPSFMTKIKKKKNLIPFGRIQLANRLYAMFYQHYHS